jgi:hypothetical protein
MIAAAPRRKANGLTFIRAYRIEAVLIRVGLPIKFRPGRDDLEHLPFGLRAERT